LFTHSQEHKPDRDDERHRIEKVGGWITVEKELDVSDTPMEAKNSFYFNILSIEFLVLEPMPLLYSTLLVSSVPSFFLWLSNSQIYDIFFIGRPNLQLGKLQEMNLKDADVRNRVQQSVGYVTIGRVNGELGVSRAIGDLRFKGTAAQSFFNKEFTGDLVIATPEVCEIRLEANDEFILLGACYFLLARCLAAMLIVNRCFFCFLFFVFFRQLHSILII
jgi:hypothetical protein